MKYIVFIHLLVGLAACQNTSTESIQRPQSESQIEITSKSYSDLIELFKEWRAFETPPVLNGAPDYTKKTFEKRWPVFLKLQEKLNSIDYQDWPIDQQVDWIIVWA